MQAESCLELTLTLYAWQVSNRLTELIVHSGLIFLPLFWLAWKNWAQPARAQEAKSASPVSLRRMEQDVAILFLVTILAFNPAIDIDASAITYKSPEKKQEIDAQTELNRHQGRNDPTSIRVPILWWTVHQGAAGLSNLLIASIHSFHETRHYRSLALALDYTQLVDPQLRAELMQFDRDCYLPALAKLERSNPTAVTPYWRSDEILFKAGFYNDELQASKPVPSWHAIYPWREDSPEGGPKCAEWWRHNLHGLRHRIYRMIIAQNEQSEKEISAAFMEWAGNTANQSPAAQDQTVRRFLRKEPPPNLLLDPEDKQSGAVNFSLSDNLGAVGSLVGYAIVRITTSIIKIALPMVQAIVLACVYIAIPIAIPFTILRPGIVVFFYRRDIFTQNDHGNLVAGPLY